MKINPVEILTVTIIALLFFVIFATSEEGEVEGHFNQLALKRTMSECLDNPLHSVGDCQYIASYPRQINHVLLRSCMEFTTPKRCLESR